MSPSPPASRAPVRVPGLDERLDTIGPLSDPGVEGLFPAAFLNALVAAWREALRTEKDVVSTGSPEAFRNNALACLRMSMLQAVITLDVTVQEAGCWGWLMMTRDWDHRQLQPWGAVFGTGSGRWWPWAAAGFTPVESVAGQVTRRDALMVAALRGPLPPL